jgi:hypothetical protein
MSELRQKSVTYPPEYATNIGGHPGEDCNYAYDPRCIKSGGEKMIGVNTPRFFARMKAGELIPYTAFTQYSWDFRALPGTYRYVGLNGTPGWQICGSFYASVPEEPTLDDLLDLIPHSKIDLDEEGILQAAAANAVSGTHDTLTFLAEIRDLKRMWINVMHRLRSIAKNDWSLWGELLDAPNTWLQYQFGIRPLLSDIENIRKALANIGDEVTRVSNSATKSQIVSETKKTLQPGTYFDWTLTENVVVSASARGSFAADFRPSKFQFDVITTGWEIIPFSFVIDYFFSVGDALSVASSSLKMGARTAAIGHRYEVEITRRGDISDWHTCQPGAQYAWETQQNFEVVLRKPTSVALLPQELINITDTRFVNLVALLYQQLRR